MDSSNIFTVEVPLEALVKELGAKRALEFINEIRESYGDSIANLKAPTEKLTIEQIEAQIKATKKTKK